MPIRKVLPQIEEQWVSDATVSPLYKPIENFPEGIPAVDRSRLTAMASEAIIGAVIPALKELHKFISETYLPACRPEIAASGLPGGPEYYQAQIRWLTTTDLSAREVHEIGEREVARLRAAMDVVIKQTGFSGTFPEFVHVLRTDPRVTASPRTGSSAVWTSGSSRSCLGIRVGDPRRSTPPDRGADAWRIERLPGVSGALSSMSCREAFTRSDTTGAGTLPSEMSPLWNVAAYRDADFAVPVFRLTRTAF